MSEGEGCWEGKREGIQGGEELERRGTGDLGIERSYCVRLRGLPWEAKKVSRMPFNSFEENAEDILSETLSLKEVVKSNNMKLERKNCID